MNKIKVAVIGTGSLGKEHARIYAALAAAGQVEFAGIYDNNADTAARISEKHRVPVFASVDHAISACDALSIATPTVTHFELAQAALRALKTAFECEPVLMREGGSIPIVNDFKRILKADTLLLGLSLPDDNPHSPNEQFDLEIFRRGMLLSALLWPELARG